MFLSFHFAAQKAFFEAFSSAVGGLAAGEMERDRPALCIGQGVDLGRAAAARSPDRLALLPPLPPEAQRCAFTAEESIISAAEGPPAAANSWKIATQTPFAAQRTKRLYSVLCGP